ncbi:hypothetical protein DNHGIG_31450 [Collibacillus ludicampi]|uniref:Uncharacterized protein n=1 Tax=Collibacillus ludicampi TaxID=2771369 RepID=A0AAV4LIM6_9BACL|nr:hypothetical protein [Collibacillus ludicampi]GIM47596.1 hypothetical protein DNHGIG_31450 [Collibacillus ludicampi]
MTSWNVREYAQRIRELSERRRLIRAGEEIVRLALEGAYGSSRELFDEAEKRLSEAEPVRTKIGGLVSITELIHPYMDALETLYKNRGRFRGHQPAFKPRCLHVRFTRARLYRDRRQTVYRQNDLCPEHRV